MQLHLNAAQEMSMCEGDRCFRAKEPLAHILGNSFFCGRSFRVTRDTLIPRPETKMLAMRADSLMKEMDTVDTPVFADWCTGGGCIAITLLAENPTWRAYAVDSSERALAVAKENAALHGVLDRIHQLRHHRYFLVLLIYLIVQLNLIVYLYLHESYNQ